MTITYCTKCGKELDIDTFENSDRCPYCSNSFMKIQYVALTAFCISFILIFWILYWLYPDLISEKITFFTTGIFVILFVVNILTDQILLKIADMTRVKRKGVATYMSIGLILIFAYIMRPYII